MKRLSFLLAVLCLMASVHAKKPEDRYVMKTFENGQLYFILPFDIPSLSVKTKPLSADITHLTTTDSVSLKISVWSVNELSADSIVLEGSERLVITDFETFFIEPDGKLWLHRYSMSFPLSILTRLYTSPLPFKLNVFANENKIQYGWKEKEWKKEQEWMNKILHIIDNNRRFFK